MIPEAQHFWPVYNAQLRPHAYYAPQNIAEGSNYIIQTFI